MQELGHSIRIASTCSQGCRPCAVGCSVPAEDEMRQRTQRCRGLDPAGEVQEGRQTFGESLKAVIKIKDLTI